jgi:hypothetical protein
MDKSQDQIFEMIGRLRERKNSRSMAAAILTPCNMIVSDNPDWDKTGGKSKAALTQYQTVVKKYNMGGSSTGEQIYQCGTHDFETRSLNEFNNHINTIHGNESNSRAASVSANKAKVIYDFRTTKPYQVK